MQLGQPGPATPISQAMGSVAWLKSTVKELALQPPESVQRYMDAAGADAGRVLAERVAAAAAAVFLGGAGGAAAAGAASRLGFPELQQGVAQERRDEVGLMSAAAAAAAAAAVFVMFVHVHLCICMCGSCYCKRCLCRFYHAEHVLVVDVMGFASQISRVLPDLVVCCKQRQLPVSPSIPNNTSNYAVHILQSMTLHTCIVTLPCAAAGHRDLLAHTLLHSASPTTTEMLLFDLELTCCCALLRSDFATATEML
jgi:hypothetical protein